MELSVANFYDLFNGWRLQNMTTSGTIFMNTFGGLSIDMDRREPIRLDDYRDVWNRFLDETTLRDSWVDLETRTGRTISLLTPGPPGTPL